MTSLRLALKQSLEETSGSTPPPPPTVQGLPVQGGGRTSPHGAAGSVTSYHTEEDSTSPVPKKRGPGRPRKYPRSNDQPRKRGRPRKHPVDATGEDEDGFSSENEFSVAGESEPRNHDDTTMSFAASKIQSHWKKSKGMYPSSSSLDASSSTAVAGPPAHAAGEATTKAESSAATPAQQQHHHPAPPPRVGETASAAAPPPPPVTQSKPVTLPAPELVDWMRNMSTEKAREAVTPGLRVKVRFVTKFKKEGKVARKRIWYGGRITAVSKDGSKSKCIVIVCVCCTKPKTCCNDWTKCG